MRITLRPKGRYHFSEPELIEQEEHLLSLHGGLLKSAVVGTIPQNLAQAIGAQTTTVMLSAASVQKIKNKHAEITFHDIMALRSGFLKGWVRQDRRQHLVFYYADPFRVDRTLKAVVKATKDGRFLLLETHHQIEPRRLRAELKRPTLLRDWVPKMETGDP